MLGDIIRKKTVEWLQSKDCSINELLQYIRAKGELRETQIEAIETYLFLKIKGQNKPLWQLFSEGLFNTKIDLRTAMPRYPFMKDNPQAYALFDFASQPNGKKVLLPKLQDQILEDPTSIDYETVIKKIFYGVNYSDYLMSLPMGSGKTYLMAAFIYLDLYFAKNEPDNKNFAHNFLVLIPSGLKTSIGPSLRTIESFDPSWIIPEPAASDLKRNLKFEILDEAKSAKKANKARNPNAQKVKNALYEPFANVFVVNAEKVILDKVDKTKQLKLKVNPNDEDYYANELRNLIGQIPNLSLLIDEVHHAASSDIKLRKVVNHWNDNGNITSVIGFTGTPYLSKAENIQLTKTNKLRISEITNTVYYYPLTTAIEQFLKNPTVKIADNQSHLDIIKNGIQDFQSQYGELVYENGTIPKLAIYCSNIEMLEEQVYPFLQTELKIDKTEILRFHGGNKTYKLPKANAQAFKSLDFPSSKIRYILLVAIGKEGWDCRSLTSVILPQKSKSSSKSAIVQTACRCLRQVTKGKDETALIWLNRENAKILNDQLQKEQNTSIEELNQLNKVHKIPLVERHNRMELLKLPKVDFYQLRIKYQAIEEEATANTAVKLNTLLANINKFKKTGVTTTTNLDNLSKGAIEVLTKTGTTLANFNSWLKTIAKESFNTISIQNLLQFETVLNAIFNKITFKNTDFNKLCFNDLFNHYQIKSKIRIAFSIKRHLETSEEILKEAANLLIINKLKPIEQNNNIYPDQVQTNKIIALGTENITETEFNAQKAARIEELVKVGKFDEIAAIASETLTPAVTQKDKTFHILPYNFDSGFEMNFLEMVLNFKTFQDNHLEIYFNGERGLSEFVIKCFAKNGKYWQNIGKYTPDFLMIQRNENNDIHKALIIETKGAGFANDEAFKAKKRFVETEFLKQNNEQFQYKKFDFLYLEDSNNLHENLGTLKDKIEDFFINQ